MSLFISFEGGERSGKSTQAHLAAEWLASTGIPTVLVREPGSTPLGQTLRRVVKGLPMTPMAELLVFAAARAELVQTVLRPRLEKNHAVVADRFADSTLAYQQHARQMSPVQVGKAIELATAGLKPDITFLLDLPIVRQQRRPGQAQISLLGDEARKAEMDDGTQTRFERESQEFHRRVRTGYAALAKQEPERWVVLDATQSIAGLHQQVRKHLAPRLPKAGPKPAELVDLTVE